MDDILSFDYRLSHDYPSLIERWKHFAGNADLNFREICISEGIPVYGLLSENKEKQNVYLSAGIHGDEPAGVWALLLWSEINQEFFKNYNFTIFPCLNPWGCIENNRLNSKGNDLNRSWDKNGEVTISEVIKRSEGARFRLAINLHEDYDANGIYLYEPPHGKKRDDLADKILSSGRKYIPIDTRKKIEGRWARNGVIRPAASSLPKEGLPEAAFLQKFRSDRTFVFETPSEYDLRIRVQAQVAMLERAVSEIL
jgi:protein MpaA